MNQFCPATMIARTTLGTHNPRITAQTVTHRLREIGERPPYTMYVLYAAFLFWPSTHAYVYHKYLDTLNTFNVLCPLNKAKGIFKGSS